MPIPIFNTVASFFLKRRISQIELFKDYPIEVQQEVLRKLTVYSIDTEIGKKFDFKTIRHYNNPIIFSGSTSNLPTYFDSNLHI